MQIFSNCITFSPDKAWSHVNLFYAKADSSYQKQLNINSRLVLVGNCVPLLNYQIVEGLIGFSMRSRWEIVYELNGGT